MVDEKSLYTFASKTIVNHPKIHQFMGGKNPQPNWVVSISSYQRCRLGMPLFNRNIWWFPQIGVPPVIIHFMGFSLRNHPAMGVPPWSPMTMEPRFHQLWRPTFLPVRVTTAAAQNCSSWRRWRPARSAAWRLRSAARRRVNWRGNGVKMDVWFNGISQWKNRALMRFTHQKCWFVYWDSPFNKYRFGKPMIYKWWVSTSMLVYKRVLQEGNWYNSHLSSPIFDYDMEGILFFVVR